MKKCVNCGYENADSARFCENCGTTDFVSKKKCPQCNSAVKPEAKFCFECGYNFLTGNAPAASGTPDNISIGDKNVFAGDVVGKQENMKFFGNATIVKNVGELKIMLTRSLFLSKTQVFYHQ